MSKVGVGRQRWSLDVSRLALARKVNLVWLLLALPFIAFACGDHEPSDEPVGSSVQFATLNATQKRIAGFELLADWSVASGTGTLSLSADRVEGTSALAVSSTKSVAVQSVAFGTVSGGFRKVAVKVKAPSTSKAFLGTLELQLVSLAKALNVTLGKTALNTAGGFQNYTFVVPQDVVTLFGSSHPDLQFRLTIDLQSPAAISLDQLVLSGASADKYVAPWGSTPPAAGSSLAYASDSAAPPIPNQQSVSRIGAMVDTIPIEVAPGRAGMQPNLSLAYDSGGGNGTIGVGWGLAGVSSIRRCATTVARDGVAASIRVKRPHIECAPGQVCPERFTEYEESVDSFCLDGQKLIKTGGTNADPEFRTERDTFVKVTTSYAGQYWPATFKVYTKDGRIHTYDAGPIGTGYDARDANGIPVAGSDFQGVLAWHLSRTEDRYGNLISYSYGSGAPNIGGVAQASTAEVLTEIDYTACTSGSSCNQSFGAATKRVRFDYEDRPDLVGGFVAGLPAVLGKRLKSIRTEYQDSQGAFATLRMYLLSYDQSGATNRSRLTQLQECPLPPGEQEGTACQPPIRFTWGKGEGPYFRRRYQIYDTGGAPATSPSWQCQGQVNASTPQPGCVWADYRSLPSDFTQNQIEDYGQQYFIVGDFDGNGTDDLIFETKLDSNKQTDATKVTFTRRSGLSNQITFDYQTATTPDGWMWFRNNPVDIDADGQVEVLRMVADGDLNFQGLANYKVTRWSPATKQFEPIQRGGLDLQIPGGFESAPSFMDMNGDGFLDIIYSSLKDHEIFHSGQFFYNLAHPVAVGVVPVFSIDPQPTPYQVTNERNDYYVTCQIKALDLAGKGRRDFYRHCDGIIDRSPTTRYLDVNGDGTDDSVVLNPGDGAGTLQIKESTGIDLQLWGSNNQPEGQMRKAYAAASADSHYGTFNQLGDMSVVDFDGDGRQDLIDFGTAGVITPDPSGAPVRLSRARRDVGPANCGSDATPCQATQFETIRLPSNGERTIGVHAVGDFNGDGLPDIVQGWKPTTNSSGAPIQHYGLEFIIQDPLNRDEDVITRVDDSKRQSSFTYYSGPTANFDTDATAPLPKCIGQHCVRKASHVVVSAHIEQGTTVEEKRYYYESPVADVSGRGFLGYGSVTEWNVSRAQSLQTVYDLTTLDGSVAGKHSYPYANVPASTQWLSGSSINLPNLTGAPIQAVASTLLNRSSKTSFKNTIQRTNANLTYFTQTELESTIDADNGNVYRSSTKSTVFDAFGNAKSMTTSVDGGEARVTTTVFSNTVATWLIGLPKTVSVTSTRNAEVLTQKLSNTFSSVGTLKQSVVQPGDANLEVTTDYAVDGAGQIKSSTAKDKLGNRRFTLIEYDPTGTFPQHVQDGAGHDRWFLWQSGIGQPIAGYDAGLRRTEYKYDIYGRAVSVKREGFAPVWLSYDSSTNYALGLRVTTRVGGTSVLDAIAPSYSEYDQRGRLRREGRTVNAKEDVFDVTEYDALAQPMSQWRAQVVGQTATSPTTFQFDNVGNLVSRVDVDGARLDRRFISPLQRQSTRTTGAGTFVSLDLMSADGYLLNSVETASEGTRGIANEYGPFGVLRKVTEAGGPTKEYRYDALTRPTVSIEPESGQTNRSYNGFGQVIHAEHLARSPSLIEDYKYDVLGRVTESTVDGETSTYAYDLQGSNGIERLGYSLSPDGVYKLQLFDAYGRPYSTTTGDAAAEFNLTYSYDSLGRVATLDYPRVPGSAQLQVGYQYDAVSGALSRLYDTASGQELYFSFSRDPLGRSRDSKQLGYYEAREIDPTTLAVTRILGGFPRSAPTYDVNYRYYSGGNPSLREEKVDKKIDEFYYNGFNELGSWVARDNGTVFRNEVYKYDQLGNLLGTTDGAIQHSFGTGNAAHQLTSQANFGWSFKYDELGRQTDKFGWGGTTIRHVDYNAFDLPRKVVSTPTGSPKTTTINYRYDAAHTRFQKNDGATTTTYVSELYEKRESSTAKIHVFYLWADGRRIGQRVLTEGNASYQDVPYYADGLDSVTAAPAGTATPRVWYSPWGAKHQNGRQSLASVTVGFTGQEQDDESGLINMRGRIYDPSSSVFLSPDPLVSAPRRVSGHNPYSYAFNNPLVFTDPSGFRTYNVGDIGLQVTHANGMIESGGSASKEHFEYDSSSDALAKQGEDSAPPGYTPGTVEGGASSPALSPGGLTPHRDPLADEERAQEQDLRDAGKGTLNALIDSAEGLANQSNRAAAHALLGPLADLPVVQATLHVSLGAVKVGPPTSQRGRAQYQFAYNGAKFLSIALPLAAGAIVGGSGAAVDGAEAAEIEAAEGAEAAEGIGALPKPPTGAGRVPKSARDPKRLWTSSERATMRAEQGNKCANCGAEIDAANSRGHHIERHADGGRTNSANHAEVCVDCHNDLHSP